MDRRAGITLGLLAALTAPVIAVAQTAPPCEELALILEGQGQVTNEVCRVNLPRGDLDVSLLGASLPPGMGLTSWAAFHTVEPGLAIVMGDLALTPGELGTVMSGLRENELRVTAVHRHMLGEEPPVVFMHYTAMGSPQELARKLDAALERAPSARGRAPAREANGRGEDGVVAGTDCRRVEEILGAPSGSADTGPGFCKVSLSRPDGEVTAMGAPVPPELGIASWFAFRETEYGQEAVIAGDMALLEEQVNPALAALREHGIQVVALHNHLMEEEPRLLFFHFQARGDPVSLAEGLRAGIDAAREQGPLTGNREL